MRRLTIFLMGKGQLHLHTVQAARDQTTHDAFTQVRTCDILLYATDFTYSSSSYFGKVTRHKRRCALSRNGGCNRVPTQIWIISRDSCASSGNLKRI
jgi:hypothetical protein